jgi:hypothetical protein
MCDASVFDIYFTDFGADLTTVLPVLFKYCYKYCYSDSRKLWAVMKGGGHYGFQFSGCWLTLSVYILMSFDFPIVRLLGVR